MSSQVRLLRFNYYSEEVNCRTLGVSTYRSLSDSAVVAEVETNTFCAGQTFASLSENTQKLSYSRKYLNIN